MLERTTFAHRLRAKLRRWLDTTAFVRTDFSACGRDAHVDPGVHIVDPATVVLGERSAIYRGCTLLTGPGRFVLGNDSHLAGFVYVNALHAGIVIGEGVAIGPFSTLLSYSNAVQPGMPILKARTSGVVEIGDDVFIGAGVVVLPGVSIGTGAVVGAGSVVNRNVAPRAIVGGVPARFLKERV